MKKEFLKATDLATIIGLVVALIALLLTIILEGSEIVSFLNLPAFILILFGVLGATAVSYGVREMLAIPELIRHVFAAKELDPEAMVNLLASFSEKARREGLLKLEDDLKGVQDPFLKDALQLVIDGTDMELLQRMLRTKIDYIRERHKKGEMIFMTMGGYAPTLGIVGTVMGLIHVLAFLQNIEKIGPGIAQAFLATFYGIASANLILIPFASKLKLKSEDELLIKELIIEGVLSIQSGDNPRLMREKLSAFLPPKLPEKPKKIKPAVARLKAQKKPKIKPAGKGAPEKPVTEKASP